MTINPKKSLGQHFLNSRHVLEQIVQASNVQKGETVLEIGPGTGILTEALLESGANIVAVEKDDRAFSLLQEKYAKQISEGVLNLIHGDILEIPVDSYIPRGVSYCIVANIPYYITGAILQKFLENDPRPDRMVLLVQKEVADRIVARDGKESILSVSVKAFGTPRIVAKVPRGAFTPPPNVDSAILSIENISDKNFREKSAAEAGHVSISRFFDIVKSGFAHKRKFLVRNLESSMEKKDIERAWSTHLFNEKTRAEDLKLEDWLKIASE